MQTPLTKREFLLQYVLQRPVENGVQAMRDAIKIWEIYQESLDKDKAS